MKKNCFLSNKKFDKSWKIPFLENNMVSVLNTAILLIQDYSIDLLDKLKDK